MLHSAWDFVNSLWPVVLHSCTSGDVFAAAKSVLVSTHHNDASLARIRPDRDTFVFRVVACSDAELHLLRRAGDLEVCFIWFDLFRPPFVASFINILVLTFSFIRWTTCQCFIKHVILVILVYFIIETID